MKTRITVKFYKIILFNYEHISQNAINLRVPEETPTKPAISINA